MRITRDNPVAVPSELILAKLSLIEKEVNISNITGIEEDLKIMDLFKRYIISRPALKQNTEIRKLYNRVKRKLTNRQDVLKSTSKPGPK